MRTQKLFDDSKNREIFKASLANLDKAFKADTKENVAGYYAAIKVAFDAAEKTANSQKSFASDVRGAWATLYIAKKVLRDKADTHGRLVRMRDDMLATIADMEAKRTDNIIKLVLEAQASEEKPT